MTTPVEVDGGTVHVLATVQGLAAEARRARDAYARVRPAALAVGLSPENVDGLRTFIAETAAGRDPLKPEPKPEPPAEPRRHADGTLYVEDVVDPYEYEAEDLLTASELTYGKALKAFGEVLLPPRDLVDLVARADEDDVPVEAVDFTDEEYGAVFAQNVSTWQLIRYSRRTRRLEKRPPKADDARAFAIAWDAYLRHVKGIAAVERARETRMAARARDLAHEHGTVLLVVEAPREAGVLDALRDGA